MGFHCDNIKLKWFSCRSKPGSTIFYSWKEAVWEGQMVFKGQAAANIQVSYELDKRRLDNLVYKTMQITKCLQIILVLSNLVTAKSK